VAISDITQPDILHYLLTSETNGAEHVALVGKDFIAGDRKARLFQIEKPGNMPWDLFEVDFVLDTTHKNKDRESLSMHLEAGARRVILSTLPDSELDRVVIHGVNHEEISVDDRIISAGSGTTNAVALMVNILEENFGVEHAIFTTIHEYTGDQALRDVANRNPRRSRSAVENIIPNHSPSPEWLQRLLPTFWGRIEGSALNVPVPAGSMLDLTTLMKKEGISKDDVIKAVEAAAEKWPDVVSITHDPIVSTDVIGNTHSLVFDAKASMPGNSRMFKSIFWYHNTLSLAARIKELITMYSQLDAKKGGQS
jgi:glyceraldehyde 3-phosphate dehydrogenase